MIALEEVLADEEVLQVKLLVAERSKTLNAET
jgi:hypothetical protein